VLLNWISQLFLSVLRKRKKGQWTAASTASKRSQGVHLWQSAGGGGGGGGGGGFVPLLIKPGCACNDHSEKVALCRRRRKVTGLVFLDRALRPQSTL
jgi:hypothetical protein